MTFVLIAIVVCGIALGAFEVSRRVRDRKASARRRVRMRQRSARQKTWDLVFGRRVRKRLSFDPTERADD